MFRLPVIARSGLMILHSSSWLILFAGVAGLLNASEAQATNLYVNATCGDDAKTGNSPNCADANGPKRTIQNAINVAIDTDEIEVAPGTYNEVIDFIGKAITLRSTDPSDAAVVAATIIDGTGLNNSVVKCVSGEDAGTVLDGFTITGGDARACPAPLERYTCGGGMYNVGSTPTVSNCMFNENTGGMGGGMRNSRSSPAVTNCTFSGNSGSYGGGMSNWNRSSPTVNNCTFSGNSCNGSGAGMFNRDNCSPTVTNCTFSGNLANGFGGGMYNDQNSSPTVTNCTFDGNTSESDRNGGGGMFNDDNSNAIVTKCMFRDNTANYHGGGMYNRRSSPVVTDCNFSGNSSSWYGGGMSNKDASDPTVINCTFSANTGYVGGGMYCNLSSPTVANCAFSGNTGTAMYISSSDATVTECTFSGNVSSYGGGMLIGLDSSPMVARCRFTGNSADEGGGMFNRNCRPTVTDCTFVENRAYTGGGMYNMESGNPTVTNCAFRGNAATDGGGMYNSHSDPTVTNCTITGNAAQRHGGGMYDYYSSPTVANCTISGNVAGSHGGGMFIRVESSPTVTNCIFWGNVNDSGSGWWAQLYVLSSVYVSSSSVQDDGPNDGVVFPGTGNIDTDPLFVRNPDDGGDGWGDDPETAEIDEGANDDFGDLRLQRGSLCINAGDPEFIPEHGETDLDGHSRVLCGRVDMGAYEFGIGDYDCSDVVDLPDFSAWSDCMTGPDGGPYGTGCEAFDFDGDLDVDQQDYAGFAAVLSAR